MVNVAYFLEIDLSFLDLTVGRMYQFQDIESQRKKKM